VSGYLIVLLLPALLFFAVGGLLLARRRLHSSDDELIDAIDALLPQTQCAQCGYPGCRPYAEALAAGAAANRCPPGGAPVQSALEELLGRTAATPLPTPAPARAVIDEASCIGCFLCIEACPVDAIAGAPQFLHTVIEDRCTGCELCLDPCPVDCITLKPAAGPAMPVPTEAANAVANQDACIRCGDCRDVCPEALLPDQLWWFARDALPDAAREHGLDACIECGLCNPVCPSDIDLVGAFTAAKARLQTRSIVDAEAKRARKLYEERQTRLEQAALIASDRRRKRLEAGSRQW
jgi:electron transport complex protein RnfB